ncbi:MAG: magnesium/cobalt transporter CorA [Gemmatimonadota bacterium]|jgi:magnesium transporter|nr:magnesium/cobalt transporter CorA [Gemmatimonadota bacterium]
MLQIIIKFEDGTVSMDPTRANIERALSESGTLFWLDFLDPTPDEIALLTDPFGFHPLAIEDCISKAQRSKIERYHLTGSANDHSYFYMVIHGLEMTSPEAEVQVVELDTFSSERYLLTLHDSPMPFVDDVFRRVRMDLPECGIDGLLYQILDHLVDGHLPVLERLQDEMDILEDEAVSDPSADLLTRVAAMKRQLLQLRKLIGPQREVLAQMTRGEVPFIRETTRIYLRDVLDHLTRNLETIELCRELIISSRDIYMSNLNNSLNQVMKALTIITVTALPATVITSFFGQNFTTPLFDSILHSNLGFWLTIATIVMLVGGLLEMFRRWKWL